MQLSLHHKCQISRIARFSLLESLRMRIGEKSTPFMPSFRFFLLFLHIVIKGKRFAKREWNEKWCYICLHIAQWQKKNPQTATPVLSSSRIICKICNLFSKFFTYVYIYNRRRRSVSLFVQNLFLVGVEVTRKFFNLWSINTHSGGKWFWLFYYPTPFMKKLFIACSFKNLKKPPTYPLKKPFRKLHLAYLLQFQVLELIS